MTRPTGRARGWYARHDPGWYTTRRALRAAVVMPSVFAICSQLIGNAQTATFGAFGSFALLLFVDFAGNRAGRTAAYGSLAVCGAVLISLGTLLSRPGWLAVAGMAVFGFLVLFAGALSSVIAAAGRAALLTFILPVMLPGHVADIAPRLLGWAIAVAVAVPLTLFVWPPTQQNRLRTAVARNCRALATMLDLSAPPDGPDRLVALMNSLDQLRAAFRASASRPVALSTGSRLLMRLVDELEWLTTTVVNACADNAAGWPPAALALREAAADALRSSAAVLDHGGAGPTRQGCDRLEDCLDRLERCRRDVAAEALAVLTETASAADGEQQPGVRGEFERPFYAAHQLGYATDLTARTAAVIGAADARSWTARALGRPPSGSSRGELGAAQQITAAHLDSHSVWLHNSVRGATGLAIAVLIARASGVQHGFWVVLGALSVLRSNALSTSTTALRALGGTVVGFVVGAALLEAIGTNHAVAWTLLPILVFVAALAPDLVSFTAGQAGFTVVVVVLFNIIAPAGWTIGLLRVEDVAFGCLASLAAGVLFWPRGAAAALGLSLADAFRAAADYLVDTVERVTGTGLPVGAARERARAAGGRLDDAFRQYLAERGAKHVPLAQVTALANAATRVRLAGDAIGELARPPDEGSADAAANNAAPSLPQVAAVLVRHAEALAGWYRDAAAALTGSAVPAAREAPTIAQAAQAASANGGSLLDVVLPRLTGCGDPQAALEAERLLWSGQYLGDLDRLRTEVAGALVEVGRLARRARLARWLG